jgi:hypothetical protein
LEVRIVPYTTTGNAWPNPQVVTISFVPDGTIVGSNTQGYIYSNLQSTFNNKFGSTSTWQNVILKAAQSWAQQTNINFAVIPDSGAQTGSGPDQQGDPSMGDIRVAGYNFGNTSTLAMAYMPPPVNNFSGAGDIFFNTAAAFHIGATYDLYTVATHELGHAIGLGHSMAMASSIMYPIYNGMKSGLSTDDISGARAIYSGGTPRSYDQYGGINDTFATATDITSSVNSLTDTGVVTGLNLATSSQTEYFVLDGNVPTIGGNLTLQVQSQGLSLLAPNVTVYASDQHTVLASASGLGQFGTTLTVHVSNVGEGTPIYIAVTGADTSAFGTGAYALALNTGILPNPIVPLPNTTLLDGVPFHAGGGTPDTAPTDTFSPIPGPDDGIVLGAVNATSKGTTPPAPTASTSSATASVALQAGSAATVSANFAGSASQQFLAFVRLGNDSTAILLPPAATSATRIEAPLVAFMLGSTGAIAPNIPAFSSTPAGGTEGTEVKDDTTDKAKPAEGDFNDRDALQGFFGQQDQAEGSDTAVTDACFLETEWIVGDTAE